MADEEKNIIELSLRRTKRPLGRILLDGGFISKPDLDKAVGIQKSTGEPLGEILVRIGAIDPVELKVALSAQPRLSSLDDALKATSGNRQMLGELLLLARRITPEQFEQAFTEHKDTGCKFGTALVRLGHISEAELEAILKFQEHQGDEALRAAGLRLGDILVSAERITYEQLNDALARQQKTNKKLGDVLVEAGYVEHSHVAQGLTIQKKLLAAAVAAVLSFAAIPASASAADVAEAKGFPAAKLTVTATVLPHTDFRVMRQAAEIVITNADIDRGYVDASNASLIQVKNNSPSGYLLVFEGAGSGFREVHVKGLGRNIVISSGNGWVAQPYAGKTPVVMELSYRFLLADGLQPGTYSWPLAISINPL